MIADAEYESTDWSNFRIKMVLAQAFRAIPDGGLQGNIDRGKQIVCLYQWTANFIENKLFPIV
jgi:hypothetical protein